MKMKKKGIILALSSLVLGALLGMVLLQGDCPLFGRVDRSLQNAFPEVYHVYARHGLRWNPDDGCGRTILLAEGENLFSFGIDLGGKDNFCNGERFTSLADLRKCLIRGLEVNEIPKDRVSAVPVRMTCNLSSPYASFVKVLDVCAEAGLRNFVGFGGYRTSDGFEEETSCFEVETSCPLPHGFPVDLSARYVNRVLVEVDENGRVTVAGVKAEGTEALREVLRKARSGRPDVDMVLKVAPMAKVETVRECILAASYVSIYNYYLVGQSAIEGQWTVVRFDIARPDAKDWGSMGRSVKGVPRKDCVFCHRDDPERIRQE
ncbi:MAG: hypothetical protein MJ249_12040 [Kiritimatiellae bacterium]|nr:hypothetical protein [Kiritimatiellia bacterium]